jgi:hypothetical protein
VILTWLARAWNGTGGDLTDGSDWQFLQRYR